MGDVQLIASEVIFEVLPGHTGLQSAHLHGVVRFAGGAVGRRPQTATAPVIAVSVISAAVPVPAVVTVVEAAVPVPTSVAVATPAAPVVEATIATASSYLHLLQLLRLAGEN